MALIHQWRPPSCIFLSRPNSYHTYLKPYLFVHSKASILRSLSAALPNGSHHQSSAPIFLPFLQEEEKEEEEEEEEEENIKEREEQEQSEDLQDPIRKFFKSRTLSSTEDPRRETKLSLKKENRHISWHLAPDIESIEETDMFLDPKPIFLEEMEEKGDEKELPEGTVGEIVQIARNLPENLTLGEVLGDYEGKLDKTDCLKVLGLLGQEGRLVDCMHFFEWMGFQEPSLVTTRVCTSFFPVLGRAGMGDELMVLFRNLSSTKELRDVHVYNATISSLLCSGRLEDAWNVYELMERDNILPNHVTCSIMITVMRKLGRSAKDAWQFFEKMSTKGVKWSEEVLGALVKSFCDEGLVSEALIIQSEMEMKGIASNVIIYNTLMDAFCKSNHIEEAEGLFLEMKTKGIKPTVATFNVLIYAYGRRMQPDIVKELLVEMQEVGLEPNAQSYTCLISAYGRQKSMSDLAADAFLKMKKAGIKPTAHSYTALIHAYAVSGWHEKAYVAFENMQREGIKPSIETYTALLDAYRRAGDTRTLMKIWKLMIKEKIEVTRVTFNILVDGFAKQGHYTEARDVVSEFGKIGFHPTVMTYNMLMNAYARGGQHSRLPQLLKEMATLNLKPDSITYTTVIYAFIRARDFKLAFFYHKKMVKSGQVPDVNSYKKLRAILDLKAANRNKSDRTALLGSIKKTMGSLKPKRKKDEFWKDRKRHIISSSSDGSFGKHRRKEMNQRNGKQEMSEKGNEPRKWKGTHSRK